MLHICKPENFLKEDSFDDIKNQSACQKFTFGMSLFVP
jgi:hypothetical protein